MWSLCHYKNMQHEGGRAGSCELTHPGLPVFILFLQVGPNGLQGFLWTHRQRICRENTGCKHAAITHIAHNSRCVAKTHTHTLDIKLTKHPLLDYSLQTFSLLSVVFFIQTRRLTKAKDTSVPWLHRQVRVFDFSIKEKCFWIKSKVWKNSSSPSGWTIDETKSIMHEE